MNKVRELFRTGKTAGDLGVEIEVEGHNLPQVHNRMWRTEADGSLRGESAEYVFEGPKSLLETRKALLELSHAFKEKGSRIDYTGRAGVHVHVNCQELSLTQLYNFTTLYIILEDLLVNWCGKDRVGNLFCLRVRDAEFTSLALQRGLETKEYRRAFSTDDLRYASMNLKALPQYGSLEFRAMRSTDDMELIYLWAKSLLALRKFAENTGNPQEFIYKMSVGGEDAFVDEYLPHLADQVKLDGWKELLKDGMRRAQDIAFFTDWEVVGKPVRNVGGLDVDPDFNDDFPPIDF